MSAPAPRVWLKWSAAVTDRNGRLWWPVISCRCRTLGVQMPDGRRIPWSQLEPERLEAMLHAH